MLRLNRMSPRNHLSNRTITNSPKKSTRNGLYFNRPRSSYTLSTRRKIFILIIIGCMFMKSLKYLHTHVSKLSRPHLVITKNDKIMHPNIWTSPIVIKEYKLIFFRIPKVCSTEWNTMLFKMTGLSDIANLTIAAIEENCKKITRMHDIPLEEAQHMMTSKEWTKAIFVREPKERILSAFLNKFCEEPTYFQRFCCSQSPDKKLECSRHQESKNFTYFLEETKQCPDAHWNPQTMTVDQKWWPYINFIGYQNTAFEDTRRLLQTLVSSKDNVTAWDRFGRSGWGSNKTEPFMYRPHGYGHATGAKSKLLKYYNAYTEQTVERFHARQDLECPYFKFVKMHLFH